MSYYSGLAESVLAMIGGTKSIGHSLDREKMFNTRLDFWSIFQLETLPELTRVILCLHPRSRCISESKSGLNPAVSGLQKAGSWGMNVHESSVLQHGARYLFINVDGRMMPQPGLDGVHQVRATQSSCLTGQALTHVTWVTT
ncbi:hypothetical protein RRG08_040762 [Elysia crispata]|uniref:Uncharacterized protein n=1 Tax=Elysia crispata TaxID=231223 RepID=A0AAE1EF14_9GAST|nr:hypothetical protein RRG08_040762 [Elysia crispata]